MNLFKRLKNEETGHILILSLIFLAFGSLTLVPLLDFTFTEMKATSMYKSKTYDMYTCDSAVEDAVHKLIKTASPIDALNWGDSYTYTTEEINGRTADVTITKLGLLSGIIGDDEYLLDQPHEGWITMSLPPEEVTRNYEEDWVEYQANVDFNYDEIGNRKVHSIGMYFSPYPGDIVTGPYDEVATPVITFDNLESFEERISLNGFSYIYRWIIPIGPEFTQFNRTGSLSLKFRVDDADWVLGTFFSWATIKSNDISLVLSTEMVKWQIEATVNDTTIRAEALTDIDALEIVSWELLKE